MRWLVLVGAVLFAYLALVPGGLVISTIDPACAGPDCDRPLAEAILLGALYALCFAALVACAATMVLYFFRTSIAGELWIRRALVVAFALAGATLFAQFALAFPLAALFTFAVGAAVYGSLRRFNRPGPEPPVHDPSTNGKGRLNGGPG